MNINAPMKFCTHLRPKYRGRMLLTLALILALPSSGFAADFYAIVDNFGRKPLNAYLDTTVDAASGGNAAAPEVLFNVYDAVGVELAEFFVSTQDGFASTFSAVNLFDLANGQPILVRARTPTTATNFGAALHTEVRGAHMVVGALHRIATDGTAFGHGRLFSVPLGEFQKAVILIANVSGSIVGVESFRGAKGPDGTGTQLNVQLFANTVHKVNLTRSEAFSNYIVNSTGLVIVQVVIDDGRHVQSYMVPPSR